MGRGGKTGSIRPRLGMSSLRHRRERPGITSYKDEGVKSLKKLIIAGVIIGLLTGSITGCQTLKSAFCSPTAQEVADAADFVTTADSILNFMSSLVVSPEVTAAIGALKIAKAVFDKIKAGICVSADQKEAAQTAIKASKVMAMKLGYKP